jgi:uncharacterized membrane protein
MLPDPLHPALVHLPIAFAALAPLLALAAILAIRSGFLPARVWAALVLLHALLAASAGLAVWSGEREEEAVERYVAERHIEPHEEWGERFLWASVGALAISAVGLARGRMGSLARLATLACGAGLLGLAFEVGHTGGELVYRHGAASAYAEQDRSEAAADLGRLLTLDR